ncbi:hypothetical protein [Actinoplanes sp. M2I2]|uniref:hypothetical protein n=1 Tax=Actinoplanes sp. M2I2 TaxID=1734444 RepID=UPI0020210379|nr:hypothetical protein [Actinoplanes sp. M2I2]
MLRTQLTPQARHLRHNGAFYSYYAASLGRPAATAVVVLIAPTAYTTSLAGLSGALGPAADCAVDPAGGSTTWWPMWALTGWAWIAALT